MTARGFRPVFSTTVTDRTLDPHTVFRTPPGKRPKALVADGRRDGMARNRPIRGARFIREYVMNWRILAAYLGLCAAWLATTGLTSGVLLGITTDLARRATACDGLACGILGAWIVLAAFYPTAILLSKIQLGSAIREIT